MFAWCALGVVILLSGYMRLHAVASTYINAPYRADAGQYYDYAYNVRHFGVYSHDHKTIEGESTHPTPDAMRPPGYSLLLTPFASAPPTRSIFHRVEFMQALLGVLVVIGIFLLFRQITSVWLATTIAALVAISPQQVVIATYILSENLFTLLLVLIILVAGLAIRSKRGFMAGMLALGVCIGLAALTRPVLEYFLPCLAVLLLLTYTRGKAWKACVVLLVGFVLIWGPWVVRNYITLGKAGDSHLMIATLHQGMYPDMMYNNMPASLAVPYRFDPDYKRDDATLGTTLTAMARQWREQPLTQLKWYLIGKPIQLWSWDMIANNANADVFIYPTQRSPYRTDPVYRVTHALMRGLHWILVLFGFLGSLYVLLPRSKNTFAPRPLFLLRSMSLLLIYNTALLMLGAPFPRYSTPFLPIMTGMAVVFASVLVGCTRQLLAQSRNPVVADHDETRSGAA